MKIYSLCVDPERGRYIAIADDETVAFSHTSEEDAVGRLVAIITHEQAVTIGPVISIPTSEEPTKP